MEADKVKAILTLMKNGYITGYQQEFGTAVSGKRHSIMKAILIAPEELERLPLAPQSWLMTVLL